MLDFKLAPVLRMVRPEAFECQRFANAGAHQVADDRHGVGFSLGDKAGDGVTILFIVVGNALNRALERLQGPARDVHKNEYKTNLVGRQGEA